MRWLRVAVTLLVLPAMFALGFYLLSLHPRALAPPAHGPVVVFGERRLAPVFVFAPDAGGPAEAVEATPAVASATASAPSLARGDAGRPRLTPLFKRRRIPVSITMYCLKGTTRLGHPVRDGIIAADPRVVPLGRDVDLYVGLRYYGRFRVDDTGKAIQGAKIDIWTASCRDAIHFGRQRGAVVLLEEGKRK